MAVVGVGIDVVDVDRFAASLRRTPALRHRLFTPGEAGLPDHSLAARFAAKEAVVKALGAPQGLAWHHAEVVVADSGQPHLVLHDTVRQVADALGVRGTFLSLTHDAGVAAAVVVLES
jgi:holo-[acyl-carrier protein] synthase